MRRCIFFDRDGVLNRADVVNGKPRPPWNLNDIVFEDGVAELIQNIKKLGWLTIIITNQPDAARGAVAIETLMNIQKHIATTLQVDDAFACYHDNSDNCECRKPKIGMFLAAQRKYNIDFTTSRFIGDRKSDGDAALAADIPFIWKDNGYEEPAPTRFMSRIINTKEVVNFL